ncbi:hypothetical protein [Microbacterium sp. NIBRBAC000506063]|uniref:hypothetical protein n=1 Tax=Microbacterium sp. NIBRBAC000506063 TaxID=2734618 RepID=UPI001BB6368D|nr:hypothetical protein [Microbacterium sp. NIBRBAC000506063]QTV80804.1 hypothetical protein KAE78_15405 [Microbacterium sp. NIBRBAC000506063]
MTAELICSRAACRARATHEIVWRNPRIHDEGREKIWLACEEHRDFLSEYLRARDFPVTVRAGAAA